MEQAGSVSSRRLVEVLFLCSLVFVAVYWVLGPLTHELSHILVLKALKCRFSFSFFWGFGGVQAYITPYCELGVLKSAAFFSAGLLTELFFGAFCFVVADRFLDENRVFSSILATTAGSAFVLGPVVYLLGGEGDVRMLVKFTGVNVSPFVLGGLLGVFLLTVDVFWVYGHMTRMWKEYEEGVTRRKQLVEIADEIGDGGKSPRSE
ncbi:Uncharacterised protein [uncultured archaeon]|nr:Uncharacterised protein [uncultured archaeon]